MLNNTYDVSTTMSTRENSYIEESSRILEKKISDLSVESLTSEKETLLDKLVNLIEEIIEDNKLNLATEENESEDKETEGLKQPEEKESEAKETRELKEPEENQSETKENFKKLFKLQEMPKINISKYIYRINKYLGPEISTIIISFIYIDKLTTMESLKLKIDEKNIYKLILTSIFVAIKYNEDDTDDNKFVAKVGGLTLQHLDELELSFCSMLKWELFVSENLFKKYYEFLLLN